MANNVSIDEVWKVFSKMTEIHENPQLLIVDSNGASVPQSQTTLKAPLRSELAQDDIMHPVNNRFWFYQERAESTNVGTYGTITQSKHFSMAFHVLGDTHKLINYFVFVISNSNVNCSKLLGCIVKYQKSHFVLFRIWFYYLSIEMPHNVPFKLQF